MWGGKNLDLGSQPGARRDEVSVRTSPRMQGTQVSVKLRAAKPFADDLTRADVRVLARYNRAGLSQLAITGVIGVAVAVVGIGMMVSGALDGDFPDGFSLFVVLGLIVWFGRTLVSAIRGMINVVNHGRRALYVEDGRLVYVAPGNGSGFSVTAEQIRDLEYKPNIDKFGPAIVLTTAKTLGGSRRIAVSMLDVEPQVLMRQISDFAGPKSAATV